MKEVSKDTSNVLDAVRKCSECLDNMDLNDHAASIATLQVLAQRRIASVQSERERLTSVAQSKLAI